VSAERVLAAMTSGDLVTSETGVVGRVDELYRSIWGTGLRARVCDTDGRVHHFAIEALRAA
jgi:hypothetical protein